MSPRVIAYAREEAERYGWTLELVLGRGRAPSDARQAVMRRLRADGFSYPEIGMMMGRHHTTVMHACRKVADG